MFIKETTINKLVHFLDSRIVYVAIGLFGISFVLSLAYADTAPLPTLTPTLLTANAVSPTQINLSWNAPTENFGKTIAGYKIEQLLSNGVFQTIVASTANTITTYSLTGLQTGVTYTYRVSAVYSDNTTSDPSNSASANPSPSSTVIISQPSNVKLVFIAPDGSSLSGVIISQSDYQQLVVIKDSRSVISQVRGTNDTVNNDVSGLLRYQDLHTPNNAIPEFPVTALILLIGVMSMIVVTKKRL